MGKSIPRPPNSFMLWSASNRKNVQREHPDSTNADISRVLGKKWNKMTNEAKQPWKILAEEEKQIHSRKYPGYKYQPKSSKPKTFKHKPSKHKTTKPKPSKHKTTKPKTTKPKTSKPKNILKDEFIDGFIDEFSLFQSLIELGIY